MTIQHVLQSKTAKLSDDGGKPPHDTRGAQTVKLGNMREPQIVKLGNTGIKPTRGQEIVQGTSSCT